MNRTLLISASAAAGLTVLAAAVMKAWPEKVPDTVPPPALAKPVTAPVVSAPLPGRPPFRAAGPPLTPTATGLTAAELEQLSTLQETLDNASDSVSAEPLLALIRKWAAQDPAACALWCRENLQGEARLRAVAETVGVWLAAKPEDAMAWLARHQGEAGTEQATTLGVMHLAQSDPTSAAAWLQRYPDTASLQNWDIIASRWSAANPAAAHAYLEANLPEGLRVALLPALLTAAPSGTDYGVLTANYPAEVQTASLTQAAEALSHPSPATALELAAAIPDQAPRDALTRRIFSEWQERDPAAAGNFAATGAQNSGAVAP